MDAVYVEIMKQIKAGNTVIRRASVISTHLVAAVKSPDGRWLGQITASGRFIENITTRTSKRCKTCDGIGRIPIGDRGIHWRWSDREGYSAGNTVECPDCKGDGYEP